MKYDTSIVAIGMSLFAVFLQQRVGDKVNKGWGEK